MKTTIYVLLLLLAYAARADVMFEGYSKVLIQGSPVGYVVQRYEFNKAKKEFSTISFTKLGEKAGNSAESLKSVCSDKFEPKSFAYTLQSGETTKTIDGSFSKGQMTLKITEGKKVRTEKRKLPKGIFPSSFLGYLMLQNGYKVGKKFTYQAIAEEDGSFETGEAFIKSEEKYKDQTVYKIINQFKKAQYISLVTARGEILATESPAQSLATELVKDPQDATKDQIVPASTLKLLFGKIPEGKVHALTSVPTEAPPTPAPSKSP